MNIVFLVLDIHLVSGSERVAVNMANFLVDKGHAITIVSLSRQKLGRIFNIDNRIVLKYLNFNFRNGFNIPQKIASIFIVNRFFSKFSEKAILLGVGTTYISLLAALIAKGNFFKTIGCQHTSYSAPKHFWVLFRRLFFHRLDAVISLTEHDHPKLKRLNPNSFVIPNSVSFYPEQPALLENKRLLAIGRMDYNKGFDLLLDFFEIFTIQHPDWVLRIIGEGPLKKSIITRIETSGLKERVEILPPTNNIIDQYLDASLYLMTSRTEALPMVLLEAQACGLPIVSFNCETGPSEIINNCKDGYLIGDFDIKEMSFRVSELCADFSKRKEFGLNARENVKKFFPERIYEKWEELFEEIRN